MAAAKSSEPPPNMKAPLSGIHQNKPGPPPKSSLAEGLGPGWKSLFEKRCLAAETLFSLDKNVPMRFSG
jgi:hypothetical protein